MHTATDGLALSRRCGTEMMRLIEMVPWWHAGPDRPTIELRINELANGERRCVLDSFPIIIGRSEEADMQLTDPWASRVHCGLDCVHGEFVLRDLESHNGTWVNREQVAEKVLSVGDAIDIGTTRIIVVGLDARECH